MKQPDIILCECGSLEHQFAISFDAEYQEMYINVHLSKKSFISRFIHAVKYVFGYQSKYGAFDEIILRKDKITKCRDIFTDILKEIEVGKSKITS